MPAPVARRRLYEKQVRSLAGVAHRLMALGWPEEKVARHLVDARNRLKIVARRADNASIVALIEARNIARYGPQSARPRTNCWNDTGRGAP